MADCPRTANCPLFLAFTVKSSLKVWQGFFCQGKYETCARYSRATSGQPVPLQLLPNGRTLDVPLTQLESHHLA